MEIKNSNGKKVIPNIYQVDDAYSIPSTLIEKLVAGDIICEPTQAYYVFYCDNWLKKAVSHSYDEKFISIISFSNSGSGWEINSQGSRYVGIAWTSDITTLTDEQIRQMVPGDMVYDSTTYQMLFVLEDIADDVYRFVGVSSAGVVEAIYIEDGSNEYVYDKTISIDFEELENRHLYLHTLYCNHWTFKIVSPKDTPFKDLYGGINDNDIVAIRHGEKGQTNYLLSVYSINISMFGTNNENLRIRLGDALWYDESGDTMSRLTENIDEARANITEEVEEISW